MELKKFIYETISSIESATVKINKEDVYENQEEEFTKSDINFDIFIDINNDKIVVLNSTAIGKNKNNLNRIKFLIKYNPKYFSLAELADKAEAEVQKNKQT